MCVCVCACVCSRAQVYSKWEIIAPVVSAAVAAFEDEFFARQSLVEDEALRLWNLGQASPESLGGATAGAWVGGERESAIAIEMSASHLSRYSNALTGRVAAQWLKLWQHLSVTFRDGVMILPPTPGHDHGGKQMGGAVANMIDGSGSGAAHRKEAYTQKRPMHPPKSPVYLQMSPTYPQMRYML